MQRKNLIILLGWMFLFKTTSSFASLSPPSLRSTAVNVTGSVTLYWEMPADTGIDFHSYMIYRSNNVAGPFTKVDSIFNYSQSSFTDIGVNANTLKFYYFIITRSDCCSSFSSASDTLSTIKLNVVNSGTGVAFLTWNAIHTPKLNSSSAWYLISSQYAPLPFSLIDSTQSLNYLDTTTACNAQVNYRVELRDASGSVSVSSIDGDVFHDLNPSSLTILDTVSVDPSTGVAYISWKKNLTRDVKGYIIYKFNGVSWDSLSTVYGYNNTAYTNLLSSAGTVSERYSISTIDSCNNATGFSTSHSTIFLATTISKCEGKIILNWNLYQNLSGGVGTYKIFVSKNSGSYQFAGSVGSNENSYGYSPPEIDSTYCFFVQAIGNNSTRTSSSNNSCIVASFFREPMFTYIRSASVANETEINILCYVDTAAEVISYNMLRSTDSAGVFDNIASIPFSGFSGFTVNDPDVITSDKNYFYQLEAIDSCGNIVSKSNLVKTILTKSTAENNFINLVTWDDYEGWSSGTGYFNIYRRITPADPLIYIASVASDVHEFRDDVIDYYTTEGKFCYQVQAIERMVNNFGFRDSAFSNEYCNWQIPSAFIPNAFCPYGQNPVFYPINVFVDMSNYSFRVFNRWGDKMFETNDPKAGWNGTYKNNQVSTGVYVYLLKYLDNNGNEILRRGTISLLK